MSAAARMVVHERRVSDRRAFPHFAPFSDARAQLLNRHEKARVEDLYCEAQAAADHASEALAHAITSAQTLMNELRAARAASVASRRSAHLAAGHVSGVGPVAVDTPDRGGAAGRGSDSPTNH